MLLFYNWPVTPGYYSRSESPITSKIIEFFFSLYQNKTQIDLHNKTFSGLKKSRKTISSIEEVSVLEFENADIVRNKIVSKILEVFPDK